MARHVLSKRDLKSFEARMKEYGLWAEFLENSRIEVDERKDRKCYLVGTVIISVEKDELIPSIELVNAVKPQQKVLEVDDGAAVHVLKGAKLFIKGVSHISEGIEAGKIVFIKDKSGKFIAVGKASENGDVLSSMESGVAAIMMLTMGTDPCTA
ncbi:MAG: DUF1947 domain-containing protein [Candidatus Thermoplasmatota archaeon]|jgi:PUA domain protein|nr:DUF1947 domain-containing protein [Candidatus Thermoplasmatota archaeon]MCL5988426.1 DUF1947 domain-containing protein [Candidatus Thermoplasmatota archaeon]